LSEQETRRWHPISALPMFAEVMDGQLKDVEEQYTTLQEARERPHVLDDHTVNRVIRVYTTTLNDMHLFEEQLDRWKESDLTEAQDREVNHVKGQIRRIRTVVTSILELAEELKRGTIDAVLAKSDL
jgi:hypothetical protein